MAVQTQIQTRRGSAATWTSTNPTLAAGEIGFESDTNKFKIGTGSTAWASLPYASNVSPLTTKGDLYTYSTDNARLAVGANGETLVADSSTSTGLRYTAGTVQANPVLNSAFQVWQRSTSVSVAASTTVYTADRWNMQTGANQAMTISRQATGDTTNLPFIEYCARVQRNSGQTGTGAMGFANSFETINSRPFAGKTVNVSFYARKGADYSPTSSVLQVNLYSGTGTDQNINIAGYTGVSAVIQENKTLTTTWQRFTTTAQAVSASATELALQFAFTPTGTASTNDYFEVTGVQLDVGSVALPFRTYAGTIQGELAACQRYYWRSGGNTNSQVYGIGIATATTTASVWVQNPTTMRITPSSIDFSTLATTDFTAFTNSFSGLTMTFGSPYGCRLDITGGSGMTLKTPIALTSNNSSAAYLGLSAEL
jgi:hypothetical protein